ncbi:MAG: hypothetical protein ACHP93_00610 [Solirubrobacterales bacterium]|jgi:hypothetical protein
MPIRITLDNNEVIEVDIALDDWNRAYQRALEGNTMLEIEDPDKRILSINPRRVNLVEAREPASAEEPQAPQQVTAV